MKIDYSPFNKRKAKCGFCGKTELKGKLVFTMGRTTGKHFFKHIKCPKEVA